MVNILAVSDGDIGVERGLVIRNTEAVHKEVRVGQDAVDDLVAYDGGGNTQPRDSQGFRLCYVEDVLVHDDEVGKLAFRNGADAVFQLVLIGGSDGDGAESLKRTDALVIRPELAGFCAVDPLLVINSGINILARAVHFNILLAQDLKGIAGEAGYTGLDAAQGRDRGHERIVVEGVGHAIGFCPASRTHVVGAAGAKELVGMAIAVEVGVVVKERDEVVLGSHQLGKVAVGQLSVEGRVDDAILERAVKLFIHAGRTVEARIVAHQTLDLLAFHGLAVNGGVAGILDFGIHGHDVLNSGYPCFGGGGAVRVGFRTVAILVVDAQAVG